MRSHSFFPRTAAVLLSFCSLIPLSLQQDSGDPCTHLAEVYNSTKYDDDFFINLPPKLVNECLKNVPFNREYSIDSVVNIRKASVLQSTQIYFYDPPTPELSLKPFRLNDTLEDILKKAEKNGYQDNYSFLLDLYKLYNGFHDGHTEFLPYCLNALVGFKHDFHIISLAENFNSTPEIYHVIHPAGEDFPVLGEKVVKINGRPAVDYLLNLIGYDNITYAYTDPDAKWNTLMYDLPAGEETKGTFSRRQLWGDFEDLTIEWPNGTTTTVEWSAILGSDLAAHISSTETLSNYCWYNDTEIAELMSGNGESDSVENKPELFRRATTTTRTASPITSARSARPPTGYPTANANIANYDLSVYYLNETATRAKTAVLNVKTFNIEDFTTWQSFIETQIEVWKRDGVQKLIIDVANNGGGQKALPYDAIKQFFPANKEKFMDNNVRWSPILYWNLTKDNLAFCWDVDGKDFTSVEAFVGPFIRDGDTFTQLYKTDYIEMVEEVYDMDANYTGANPFNAEDIIVVSNSLCASACHTFVEGLQQQGVRSYALGGRIGEDFTHMQAVGGVKGGTVTKISKIASIPRPDTTDTDFLSMFPNYPRIRNSMTLNLENKFRDGVHLPLEFVYTPACKKLPYTTTMFGNITNVWSEVAKIAWDDQGNPTQCDEYISDSSGTSNGEESNAAEGSEEGEVMLYKNLGQVIWTHIRWGDTAAWSGVVSGALNGIVGAVEGVTGNITIG